jgi:hypothetical protein
MAPRKDAQERVLRRAVELDDAGIPVGAALAAPPGAVAGAAVCDLCGVAPLAGACCGVACRACGDRQRRGKAPYVGGNFGARCGRHS